jgi:hypothetical protein
MLVGVLPTWTCVLVTSQTISKFQIFSQGNPGKVIKRVPHKVSGLGVNKKTFLIIIAEMGCPALGIWVAFFNSLMHCLAERPQKYFFYIFELLLIHL